MITAVDTNVLLDIFTADQRFGPNSREALRQSRAEGAVVVCEIVWAEVAAAFPDQESASTALDILGVGFVAVGQSEAGRAGRAWRDYRRGGGPRDRLIADFLVGADATSHADRLLTRDRGFYRRYFKDLQILDPANRDAT